MATTEQDTVVVAYTSPVPFPILKDGTADIKGGDMVYFDTAAKVIKSVGTNANAATFAGVAVNGSFLQPYSQKKYVDRIPVAQKARVRMKTTVGDTISEGDAVFIGADAQTVTNVDPVGGNVLGYAKLNAGQTSLAGAAGVNVEVELAVKFPTTAFA